VRWPDEAPGERWRYGSDLAYMKELVAYWRDKYDWRAHETALNRNRQFTVPVGGIGVHFIHELGVGPDPMPLLLSHGWPGSIVEFQRIIPMLTDPARFGGDPADAFTVVAPSLPGYTFSFTPNQPRFGIVEIADVFATLMTDVLGYRRFAPQGGDWGAFVTSVLGASHPDRLLTNVMLYWVTGAINSSFWPYYARNHGPWPITEDKPIRVPTAYASFPREILHPPRAWAERVYNIQRWTPMTAGGHFAALEEPDALAADVRAFFRHLR